jgi:predicted secreted protein
MANNAVKTQGTKLEINTTGTTYVQVKGLKDFSGLGGGSAAVIDTTDLDSTAREKQMGLQDEGQISINLLYISKDPGQLALRAARGTGSKLKIRITLSDTTTFACEVFVLSFEKSGSSDDIITASSSLEVTGAVVETVPAV